MRKSGQKGFIQIPLLVVIVVSILTASVGAGFVLHKQGKLSFLSANVINSVLRNVNPSPQEIQESDKENSRETEQKENNKTAEPKREIEKSRNRTDISPNGDSSEVNTQSQLNIPPSNIYPPAQDPQIKIEKCKIEAQSNIDNFLEAGKAAINEALLERMNNAAMKLYQETQIPGSLSTIVSQLRPYYQSLAKEELNKLQIKANEIYDRQYLECLNR